MPPKTSRPGPKGYTGAETGLPLNLFLYQLFDYVECRFAEASLGLSGFFDDHSALKLLPDREALTPYSAMREKYAQKPLTPVDIEAEVRSEFPHCTSVLNALDTGSQTVGKWRWKYNAGKLFSSRRPYIFAFAYGEIDGQWYPMEPRHMNRPLTKAELSQQFEIHGNNVGKADPRVESMAAVLAAYWA